MLPEGIRFFLQRTRIAVWNWRARPARRAYPALHAELIAILFRHDPIGLDYEHNTDEYEPEASTILAGLRRCRDVRAVRGLVHREFVRWFDEGLAGPESDYEAIAGEVWQAWSESALGAPAA